MKITVSYSSMSAKLNANLELKYKEFEVFSYLIEDMNITAQHLDEVRNSMDVSLEEFAEMVELALLNDKKKIENPNPWGLMRDGNRRKPRTEVRDDD